MGSLLVSCDLLGVFGSHQPPWKPQKDPPPPPVAPHSKKFLQTPILMAKVSQLIYCSWHQKSTCQMLENLKAHLYLVQHSSYIINNSLYTTQLLYYKSTYFKMHERWSRIETLFKKCKTFFRSP